MVFWMGTTLESLQIGYSYIIYIYVYYIYILYIYIFIIGICHDCFFFSCGILADRLYLLCLPLFHRSAGPEPQKKTHFKQHRLWPKRASGPNLKPRDKNDPANRTDKWVCLKLGQEHRQNPAVHTIIVNHCSHLWANPSSWRISSCTCLEPFNW